MEPFNAAQESSARRVARECFALRVQVLNRLVTRLYDDALRELGLTLNQMTILTVLVNTGGARPSVVGEFLQMEKSTVTRNVARLKQRKWVRESPDPDGRSIRLAVTEKGRVLLDRAVPVWEQAQAAARVLLGGGDAVASISELADRVLHRPRRG
jgi:DNA-binding MarR family transcriptional regulator